MKWSILVLCLVCSIATSATAQTFEWARRMGGTLSGDRGWSVAVGSSGSVYTTGEFQGPADFDPGPGTYILPAGGGIFLYKLTAAGNFVWARQMGSASDEGRAITVDAAENVYVTGVFSGTCDFDPGPGTFNMTQGVGISTFIAKYDSAGNFVWAKALSGTSGNGSASVHDITLDISGNVYTTGLHYETVDFDPGPGTYNLITNTFGNAFISKLDNSGNFLWARSPGGSDAETGKAIATDNAGNVYMLSSYLGTLMDMLIYKYNPAGTVVWTRLVGGTGYDVGTDMTVNGAGNVYVTGNFDGTADFDPSGATYTITTLGGTDAFIYSLNTSGNFVWAKRFGSTGTDAGTLVELDASGNVHTMGYFAGTADFDPGPSTYNMTPPSFQDNYLSKLDASGNFVSALQFGGGIFTFKRLLISPSGALHMTGDFSGTPDFDPGPGTYNMTGSSTDFFVMKLGICSAPPAPTNTTLPNNLTVCEGNSTMLTASGTGSMTWHTAPAGGAPIATGGSFVTPSLTANTTYYVQDSACLASPRTAIMVTVLASTSGTLTTTTCDSYLSPSGNFMWTSSGTYADTLVNSLGCDSVLTVNLTILNSNTATLSPTACDSYLSPSGQVWTSSGTYADTLVNSLGCDSVITVNLTLLNSSMATLSPTACYSYVSPSGQVWTSSGTYADTLVNAAGCDSVITVNLTILGSSTSTLSPSTCDSFISPSGQIWTSSGTYVDTIPNAAGCDSIITVQLTITTVNTAVTNNSPTLTANAAGAGYQWIYCDSVAINGATNASFTATANGNYAVIVTENGCMDTSACIAVTSILRLEDRWVTQAMLYPNPTEGRVYITLGSMLHEVEVVVRNSLGQMVEVNRFTQADRISIDLPETSGIYFVEVHAMDGQVAYFKAVKR